MNSDLITDGTPSATPAELKLQFKQQAYQNDVVQAVVDAFKGQTRAQSLLEAPLRHADSEGSLNFSEKGIANQLSITDAQWLANIQAVQTRYNAAQTHAGGANDAHAPSIEVSQSLLRMAAPAGSEIAPFYTAFANLSIEMETGTGKTYVYIASIHALHKEYGFKKFVVVVPSVAIREGALSSLEDAELQVHFEAIYGQRFAAKVYDPRNIAALRDFAMADSLQVLVMSIDSFTKDNNVINQLREQGVKPIEYLQHTRPIVIMDEPQNFETDIRRAAIANLNPLCTLRYSATHKNAYNLLYSLNPVQAYDLGLVKQIEVDGISADANYKAAFVELLGFVPSARSIKARLRIYVEGKTGASAKEVNAAPGDDLYMLSKQRSTYAAGFVVNELRREEGEVEFSNGMVITLGQASGGLNEEVMRYQIERTVRAHFQKLKKLKLLGIKVLSLFFIDKVANYRSYDAQGEKVAGKFALWFEAAFAKYAALPQYAGLCTDPVAKVHNGYFSGDKSSKNKEPIWTDTKGSTAKDDDTYRLIMQAKKELLRLDVPLQFIFSHSALREGWDNPNVFQICTLNESQSESKKRQEIGRGLRLPVNQQGERIQDKSINVLTVVANESYEAFSKALQTEIETETGVQFTRRIANARDKARVSRRMLSLEDQALFDAMWNRINFQVRYGVQYDSQALITETLALLANRDSYPTVQRPVLHATKTKLTYSAFGVEGIGVGIDTAATHGTRYPVPDVYATIQDKVKVSRSTIFAVLQQSGRVGELLVNPQAFLDTVVAALNQALSRILVDGIVYEKIDTLRHEQTLFDMEGDTYLANLFPLSDQLVLPLEHTPQQAQRLEYDTLVGEPFACVPVDSDTERAFAAQCNQQQDSETAAVRFFFKLPRRFKIPTPVGDYTPDWALVIDKNQSSEHRVYFVAETKSSLNDDEIRGSEGLKIQYARRYFKQLAASDPRLHYGKVTTLAGLVHAV